MSAGKLHPDIAIHLDEIIQICREFGITRLEVFGSAVTGEFDPEQSDLDLLVEYPAGYDWGPMGERPDELRNQLAELLGRKVDLVILQNIENPYVLQAVEKSRTLLYAA